MGHRALIAVERAEGLYDLYHSQWGADEWQLQHLLGSTKNFHDGNKETGVGEVVESGPAATGETFEAVVAEHVDFASHEALYRVDRGGGRQPFFVGWSGFPRAGETCVESGVLVAVSRDEPATDGSLVRGWFDGTKGVLGVLVDRGDLAADAARDVLACRLASWASDREYHVLPLD